MKQEPLDSKGSAKKLVSTYQNPEIIDMSKKVLDPPPTPRAIDYLHHKIPVALASKTLLHGQLKVSVGNGVTFIHLVLIKSPRLGLSYTKLS